jgi:hypothetical protein
MSPRNSQKNTTAIYSKKLGAAIQQMERTSKQYQLVEDKPFMEHITRDFVERRIRALRELRNTKKMNDDTFSDPTIKQSSILVDHIRKQLSGGGRKQNRVYSRRHKYSRYRKSLKYRL